MSSRATSVRVVLAAVLAVTLVPCGAMLAELNHLGGARHGWVEAAFFWGVVFFVPVLVLWPRSAKAWTVAVGVVAAVAIPLGLMTWDSAPPNHDRLAAYYDDNVALPEGFVESGREEHGVQDCFVEECASIAVTVRGDPDWSDEERAERLDEALLDQGWVVEESGAASGVEYTRGARTVAVTTEGIDGRPLGEGVTEVTIS